ncbi:hypothetical protein HNQ80_000194 [Anaerosolibacter carboniphilus]|uniref:Uncharacterized protein n=1 Tax=Anaerosolibacter carboniphilus TaxID=1417629 RepID=A0A841KVB1_9FIRM|nr:hypothetical protein [Anaerosolibacter carboniphilus]MBB6214125.1 hypothetical protein [Anaerosolibacter carboniphilus]
MNRKSLSLIVSMFMIVFILTSCTSDYDKQVKEYETLYDGTISQIDSENVYKSIKDNNLTSNIEELNKLLEKIEEIVPDNKINDFLVLRTKHDRLKGIIEKGLKWDSLGDLDKLSIKIGIDSLKPKQ